MALFLVPLGDQRTTAPTTLEAEREARRWSMVGRGLCVQAPDADAARRLAWLYCLNSPDVAVIERGKVPILQAREAA
jgi:hypothetical protein